MMVSAAANSNRKVSRFAAPSLRAASLAAQTPANAGSDAGSASGEDVRLSLSRALSVRVGALGSGCPGSWGALGLQAIRTVRATAPIAHLWLDVVFTDIARSMQAKRR